MNSKYKDKLVGVYARATMGALVYWIKPKNFQDGFGLIVRIWNLSALRWYRR